MLLEIMAVINAVIALVYYFSNDRVNAVWHLGLVILLHLSYKADR